MNIGEDRLKIKMLECNECNDQWICFGDVWRRLDKMMLNLNPMIES